MRKLNKQQRMLQSKLTLLRRCTQLCEIILINILKLDANLVGPIIRDFHELINSRITERGVPTTILWLKDVRLVVVRFLMKNPYTDHPNVPVDKEGFPKQFLMLKPLTKDLKHIKGLFTILNIGRAFI